MRSDISSNARATCPISSGRSTPVRAAMFPSPNERAAAAIFCSGRTSVRHISRPTMQIQVLMIPRSMSTPRNGGAGKAGVSTSYPSSLCLRSTRLTMMPPPRSTGPCSACRCSSGVGKGSGGSMLVATITPCAS